MKIPGFSGHVSEKQPGETVVKHNSPAPGKTAASVSVSIKSESPQNNNIQSQSAQIALLKALGLPADKLSASIISFAQFFSLPLEPSFLGHVRRQAAASSVPAQSQTDSAGGAGDDSARAGADGGASVERAGLPTAAGGAAAIGREALSLAAVAAADKGVELTQAALEEYAAAIDPDSGGGGGGGNNEDSGNCGSGHGGRDADRDGGQRGSGGKGGDMPEIRGGESDAPFLLPPDLLKEQFLGAAENNPLLDTLNRLPGRNGQRWLVLPLSFDENGIQYRITLKLLLDGETAGGGCSVRRMSLEITERTLGGQRGADKRRLFIMDRDSLRRGEQVDYRLTLLLDPPRGQSGLKSLAGKLSRFMEMPADRITVKNYGDSLFAPDSRNIVLQSVNKEV